MGYDEGYRKVPFDEVLDVIYKAGVGTPGFELWLEKLEREFDEREFDDDWRQSDKDLIAFIQACIELPKGFVAYFVTLHMIGELDDPKDVNDCRAYTEPLADYVERKRLQMH